ncbi:serine/threonine-protein kinase [Lacipirellula limnantheis]|uniref:non-specific serine/threonine protein kinase n=1 Tax=Lacipirellula limnantheis TaxID=2528024 RepID=A0A517TTF6_9BACT|nr:serine/threonine-protein kinase [Lacipirellula limnantheis]QDT71655.1 Serine/threonine-protein kinase PrkC [Lacipirellula limnantheis]
MPRTVDADFCELERFIDAFENARVGAPDALVEQFTPPRDHELYDEIVVELLRIDLEQSWQRGESRSLQAYLDRFGDVLANSDCLAKLAFEHYRLQCDSGFPATREDYARSYGVEVARWPELERSRRKSTNGQSRLSSDAPLLPPRFPQAAERFLDFELVQELGRGAFGCVYLARQAGLANRNVALKLVRGTSVEPERLAQLQHTNIVPIYSVHQSEGWEAVCMPYLGRNTLQDVTRAARRSGRLPRSGQELLTTVIARQSETVVAPGRGAEPLPAVEAGQTPLVDLAPSIRTRLEHANYVDAVVWIVLQVSAGVAHAHERGILHRDLKPANILLANDGRPMVLDFNLSDQIKPHFGRAAVVGGTLPYMSPEQLQSLESGSRIDERSDVYSLGVILFELVAGRLPFESPPASGFDSVPAQIEARQSGAPLVRNFNQDAPPSIESLIAHCLDADPNLRYQSVDELRADLQRHLDDLPLIHAPDRSVRERVGKWMRRHPKLASASSIGVIALAILASLTVGWAIRERRFARVEAQQLFSDFMERSAEARLPLSIPGADAETLDEGVAAARKQLARYEVLNAADWKSAPNYRLLPQQSQVALDAAIDKTKRLIDSAEDRRGGAAANALPANGDDETTVVSLLRQGRYDDAAPLLTEWRDKEPYDLGAWMLLGSVNAGIGNLQEAEECFTTCTRLRPQFAFSYFQRGLARLAQRRYLGAIDDFGAHMRLGGQRVPALVNRALAHHANGNAQAALDDLNAALAAGAAQTRIYFIRAEVRTRLGDAAGAAADRELGLSLTPRDSVSYLARGSARLPNDPEAALADFQESLRLDPGSRIAKQNIVHVLGDRLQRPEEARAMLDSILDTNRHDFRALASRAVLRARAGDRDGAATDAIAALQGDDDPTIVLQAACAFARSAATHPPDKVKSLHLAARAVGAKPELSAIAAHDPDLEALHDTEEFVRILRAANVILSGGAESNVQTSNK